MLPNYLEELLDEKDLLDPEKATHSLRLLDDEIERVRSGSHTPTNTNATHRFQEEMIRLSEKIFLPVQEFPRFNFVGKILGPKGSTLKGIQTSTKSKISILGKGSTRDRQKEEELNESGDDQYSHFKEPLHLLIQTEGPKSEAHENIAVALTELARCMSPDSPISQGVFTDSNPVRREPEERGRISQQPILRYGIPPPGAIIIDQQPHSGVHRTTVSPKPYYPPRIESPEHNTYASTVHGIAYKRYGDSTTETSQKYGKYDRDSSQLSEKRIASPLSDYPVKNERDSNDPSLAYDHYRSSTY